MPKGMMQSSGSIHKVMFKKKYMYGTEKTTIKVPPYNVKPPSPPFFFMHVILINFLAAFWPEFEGTTLSSSFSGISINSIIVLFPI